VRCALVGKASVEYDVVMSRTGLVACTNGTGGTALASKGDLEGMVLSRSQSSLHWALAMQGSLLMLLAGLSSSLTCIKSSLVLRLFPPGSCMNLRSSLMPKSLRLHGWVLRLRLRLRLLPSLMVLVSSHAGLPSMLLSSLSVLLSLLCAVLMSLSKVVWLFWETCACSGFVIGVTLLFLTLEILAFSCIWRLIGLASVALDGFGDAATIDEGGGGVSL